MFEMGQLSHSRGTGFHIYEKSTIGKLTSETAARRGNHPVSPVAYGLDDLILVPHIKGHIEGAGFKKGQILGRYRGIGVGGFRLHGLGGLSSTVLAVFLFQGLGHDVRMVTLVRWSPPRASVSLL